MGVTEGYASPHLKDTLIAWVLMTDQSDEVEDSSRPHPIICRLALCSFSVFTVDLSVFDCRSFYPGSVIAYLRI